MSDEILDKNVLQQTENFILAVFNLFMGCKTEADKYEIDSFVVMEISRRFHLDEMRIKHFHPNIKELDRHKQAGYLCYWTSKLKPIVLRDLGLYEINARCPHYINELFAFILGIGKINSRQKSNVQTIGSNVITTDFVTALLHTLKYRVTTGDNLSMLFYLVDELVPLKNTLGDMNDYDKLNDKGKKNLKDQLTVLLQTQDYTTHE